VEKKKESRDERKDEREREREREKKKKSEHLFPSSQGGSGPPSSSPPCFVDAPTLLPRKKEKKEA
jgi:hypothetical protein